MGGFERNVEMFDVTVGPCFIEPRFYVPERTYRERGPRRTAIQWAVRRAAKDAGIAPWRPWLRELAKHVMAVKDVVVVKL